MSKTIKDSLDAIESGWSESEREEGAAAAHLYSLEARLIALGIEIRKARIEAGLSQEQLSKFTGITQAQISRIERARVVADISTLCRISNVVKRSFVIGHDGISMQIAS